MKQYLGRMGETFFNSLCASAGITCNQAHEDMAGWDYVLDFPAELKLSKSPDMLPAPIECKVQVKSTNKKNKGCSITLINLLRFAKSPLPCFFVFIEYNNKSQPQEFYIVHFDERFIEKTLKQVRIVTQGNKPKNINKSVMKVGYDDSHKLNVMDGEHLKKKLESFVVNGVDSYSKKKIEFCRKVGFDAGMGSVTFTAEGEESLMAMIESSLGKKKEALVSNVLITEERFGIPLLEPLAEISKATLHVGTQNNNIDIDVFFYKNKYEAPLTFKAKLYYSPFNAFVPSKYARLRIESDFFDFMLALGENVTTYNFNIDASKEPLKVLRDKLRLISWVNKDGASLSMDISPIGKPHKKIGLNCEFSNPKPSNSGFDYEGAVVTVNKALGIVQRFSLEEMVRVNLEEIHMVIKELTQLDAVYNAPLEDFEILFKGMNGYTKDIMLKKHVVTFPFHLWLGGVLIVSITSFIGEVQQLENDQYKFNVKERKVEHELSTGNYDESFRNYIVNLVRDVAKGYSGLDYAILNYYKD